MVSAHCRFVVLRMLNFDVQVNIDHSVKEDPERDADLRAALAEASWEKVSWGLPPTDPAFVQKSSKKLKGNSDVKAFFFAMRRLIKAFSLVHGAS